MNIVFLCREYERDIGYGGIGTFVNILSKQMVKLGHRVFIVTVGEKKGFNFYNTEGGIIVKFKPVYILGFTKLAKLFGLLDVYQRLLYAFSVYLCIKKLLKIYKLDIVEYPDWFSEGLFIKLIRRVPSVVRVHGPLRSIINYLPVSKVNFFLIDLMEQVSIKNADGVIFPTKQFLIDVNIKNIKFAKIIHHPFDFSEIEYEDSVHQSETKFRITCVGRIEPRKNQEVIIKALPYILKEINNLEVIFIGRFPYKKYKNYILELAKMLNVEKNLKFIGEINRSEIFRYLMMSNIVCVPTKYESFGYSFVEGLFSGKPVIASDIPVFREITKNENVCIFVPPDDYKKWAESVIFLFQNKNLGYLMGEKAKEFVKKEFNVAKITEECLSFYKEVISRVKIKNLVKDVGYFSFALPNRVKYNSVPLKWRLYNIEKMTNYVVWYHFYLISARQILELLPFSLKGKKVLDLGSTPIISCLFALLGADVTMVDIDIKEIEKGRQLSQHFNIENKIKFIHKDLFKVEYEEEFDVVFNCGVIEHFRNSVEIIKIMSRCVKKGGYVICLVPAMFTLHTFLIKPLIRIKKGYYWDTLGDTPERSYTLYRIKTEMKIAGLHNIKVYNGNIVRNILDDFIVNYVINKLGCKWYVKKLVYLAENLCDFIERFSPLFIRNILGAVIVSCGQKNNETG
ncbi:MAG: glycosyltransferase [Endomicrobia bacterium]|nr:glycosyltransferase [Endomicrobiia bacterium]